MNSTLTAAIPRWLGLTIAINRLQAWQDELISEKQEVLKSLRESFALLASSAFGETEWKALKAQIEDTILVNLSLAKNGRKSTQDPARERKTLKQKARRYCETFVFEVLGVKTKHKIPKKVAGEAVDVLENSDGYTTGESSPSQNRVLRKRKVAEEIEDDLSELTDLEQTRRRPLKKVRRYMPDFGPRKSVPLDHFIPVYQDKRHKRRKIARLHELLILIYNLLYDDPETVAFHEWSFETTTPSGVRVRALIMLPKVSHIPVEDIAVNLEELTDEEDVGSNNLAG